MSSPEIDYDQIKTMRDHHIGRLFLQAHRAYSAHAIELLRSRGYDQLGPAHAAILPHVDLEGTRATVIAERAGMTKQGAGHIIADLEQQGLVVRIPDPVDGRASLVRFTDEGWTYLRVARDLKHDIESEYIQLLGNRAFETLCTDLMRIIDYEHQLFAESSQQIETNEI